MKREDLLGVVTQSKVFGACERIWLWQSDPACHIITYQVILVFVLGSERPHF